MKEKLVNDGNRGRFLSLRWDRSQGLAIGRHGAVCPADGLSKYEGWREQMDRSIQTQNQQRLSDFYHFWLVTWGAHYLGGTKVTSGLVQVITSFLIFGLTDVTHMCTRCGTDLFIFPSHQQVRNVLLLWNGDKALTQVPSLSYPRTQLIESSRFKQKAALSQQHKGTQCGTLQHFQTAE